MSLHRCLESTVLSWSLGSIPRPLKCYFTLHVLNRTRSGTGLVVMSWSLPQRKAQIGLGTSRSDVELKPCNYVLAETYLSVFIFESFYFIPGRRKYNMLVEEEKRHVQS